jgi:hypothetical protein
VYAYGSLLLGTDGCGMYWHLIVTGPQRGHVWLIDQNRAMPFGTRPGTCLMPGTPGFSGWVTSRAQASPGSRTPGQDCGEDDVSVAPHLVHRLPGHPVAALCPGPQQALR